MLGNLTGWHLLIIVAILLLLFGATKLPALARSVGQSAKIFRNEITSAAPAEELPADTTTVPGSAPHASSTTP